MIDYFLINNVFFTVMGYPMSYIEFIGTIFNLGCVWLVARNNIWNWPVGLVGTALFGLLFWQIALYSDFFEQIYFFITGVWGWWVWFKLSGKDATGEKNSHITTISARSRFYYVLLIALGTLALGALTSKLPAILPALFPEPTSFPYLDAFTTVMSFAATVLMIRKEIECWPLWIAVDVIGVGLYWVKDVKFISLLYAIFLVLATMGLFRWYSIWSKEHEDRLARAAHVT